MDTERARGDVAVAGAAAGMTVVLAVSSGLGYLPDVGPFATLAPVFTYFAYLFSRKGGPYGKWDTARTWTIATIGVGLIVLLVAVW